MNFDYSEDQKLLGREARRFLAERCPASRVRQIMASAESPFDTDLWQSISELGWLGLSIPEEHGGLGMGAVELCAIAEEIGRAVAPLPLASTLYLFSGALLTAGSERQKQELLPRIATGELIGCLAASEGPGTVVRPACTVSGGRLTGTKIPVTDGGIAHRAIVLAQESDVVGLYIVDLSDPGVLRTDLTTIDPGRNAARIEFSDVPAEPLGDNSRGLEIYAQVRNRAAILFAFEQIGGADRCLEMARDYALERRTFGRQIGSYQAIKHRLADMFIRNQLARSHAYYGAWALDVDAPELGRAAAAARVAACEAYWFASKEAIEIFGGIGTTWEADCHLFYRRAQQLALEVGGPAQWREQLVQMLEHAA